MSGFGRLAEVPLTPPSPDARRAAGLALADRVLAAMPDHSRAAQRAALTSLLAALGLHDSPKDSTDE
ncbi:hypothetical protein GCM10010406_21710 [Streptomyces thermolineatus]|uniref:Uncharacterized protein n=1 Tax=Streptomyces thermolineatus TaxID=44033 RepID=A0ABN3LJ63_9ACTN